MKPPSIPVICIEGQSETWERARQSFEDQSRYLLIRSPANISEITRLADRVGPAILLTSPAFLDQLPPPGIRQLWASGHLEVMVILDPGDWDEAAQRYLREGCIGVLHQDDIPEIFRKAVQSAAAGELWASRKILARLLRQMIQLETDSSCRLTQRESEILELIGSGYKNREIANHLSISKDTVRWHLRSLYSKLGISDRQAAIHFWQLKHMNG